MTRISRNLVNLCAVLALAALTTTAYAQSANSGKPPIYTWVTLWGIPRASWPEYVKNRSAADQALDKHLSSGDITVDAAFTVLTHDDGGPTHGVYWSSTSMAGLLKVLEDLRSSSQNTSSVLSGAHHWDEVLISRHYGAKPGTYHNAYMRAQSWYLQEGSQASSGDLIASTIVPVLDKLLADGSVCSYAINEEAIHTEDPGWFEVVIATPTAEGQDAFDRAVLNIQKTDPAALAAFRSIVSEKGHRDSLNLIDSLTIK